MDYIFTSIIFGLPLLSACIYQKRYCYNMLDMTTNLSLNHLAIIPDGNRRWARARNLPPFLGHQRGFDRANELVKEAHQLGIKIVTLWAFSTENWRRTQDEITYLMDLYLKMIDRHLKEALKNSTRIIHIGRKDRINQNLLHKITQAEALTKKFYNQYLVIALDYGGQDEIVRAITKEGFNPEKMRDFLDTRELPFPEPDLIIRTSGEMRISGFMLWQSAYSEYFFSPKYFPDFTKKDLHQAILEYHQRQRRFGGN